MNTGRQQLQTSQKSEPASAPQHSFSGRHLLASYIECDEDVISDATLCLKALRKAADASKVTVVAENIHHFPNGAVTAILLLAESHASIHTYPEHRSCFIDFFTCGEGNIEAFHSALRKDLKPASVEFKIIERGCSTHVNS